MSLDDDVKAVANTGGIFQSTMANSLIGLISANNERRVEIESVMGNHETLRKDHDTPSKLPLNSKQESKSLSSNVTVVKCLGVKRLQFQKYRSQTSGLKCLSDKEPDSMYTILDMMPYLVLHNQYCHIDNLLGFL